MSRQTKSGESRSRIRRQVKIERGHRGSGTELMSTTFFMHKTWFEPFHNCWGFRKTRQKRYRCKWQLNMRWKEILIFKENHIPGNSYTMSMGITTNITLVRDSITKKSTLNKLSSKFMSFMSR